jgi:hypothetical protein
MSWKITDIDQSAFSRLGEEMGIGGSKTYTIENTETGEVKESCAYNETQLGENIRDGLMHDPD